MEEFSQYEHIPVAFSIVNWGTLALSVNSVLPPIIHNGRYELLEIRGLCKKQAGFRAILLLVQLQIFSHKTSMPNLEEEKDPEKMSMAAIFVTLSRKWLKKCNYF